MAVTITQAKDMLERYIKAEQEVLEGKTIMFSGRMMSMAELGEIRTGRQEWERTVNRLNAAAAGRRPGPKLAVFE
ncbi:primosomal replication protein PriB/PriC domain protein [Metapseudomonas lalkuanensis]|uniref:primosomal replication protein PriB/PriC domain protein n=1 Tax=Metapseudomonas lalkuanensis TaxID=2604832 RepID=UPI001CF103C4|nr:primosomal replication protein PriB/PriC domain protein [Pseudomonas lalkuanensis]UCP00093.1 primosomal replication protein PriB/PriC domain protein [Pseudomonas lalkuanensis]